MKTPLASLRFTKSENPQITELQTAMATLAEQLNQIHTGLNKVNREVVQELARLRTALEDHAARTNVEIPAEAQEILDRIKEKVTALDDLIPDGAPVEGTVEPEQPAPTE